MTPPSFRAEPLVELLRSQQIADIAELKAALGRSTDMIVFRKLREIDYLSNYSHRRTFYALRATAHFDQQWRLFAGLESLRLGRGRDRRISELLSFDPHTVGRGRKALADWDLQVDRVRRWCGE